MHFLSLKSNNLLDISEFLTFKEIAKLSTVCKYLNEFIKARFNIFQRRLASEIGESDCSVLLPWATIFSSLVDSLIEFPTHVPYYTNGGRHANSTTWSIHKLVLGENYCSVAKENILVKYCYLPIQHYKGFDSSDLQFREVGNIYHLEQFERMSLEYSDICPNICGFDFSVPNGGFSCPVSVFMVFGSLNPSENSDFIQNFHSLNEIDQVFNVCNQLKIKPQVEDFDRFTLVRFETSKAEVYPLAWVKMKPYIYLENLNFKVELKGLNLARYFYLLLIDAYRRRDNNIDIGMVVPFGNILKLRN